MIEAMPDMLASQIFVVGFLVGCIFSLIMVAALGSVLLQFQRSMK
jgi:cell division protein FtsL